MTWRHVRVILLILSNTTGMKCRFMLQPI